MELWDWRRRVSDIYATVRTLPPEEGWHYWRDQKDALFRDHPESPVRSEGNFDGLHYQDYDEAWRFELPIERDSGSQDITHSDQASSKILKVGYVRLPVATGPTLCLFWFDTYGGGVFLPFRDATNGQTTYERGRYLLDTGKGTDLGSSDGSVVLDFNFSYHPSCVYDPNWSCPLAPAENHLPIEIPVGEVLGQPD